VGALLRLAIAAMVLAAGYEAVVVTIYFGWSEALSLGGSASPPLFELYSLAAVAFVGMLLVAPMIMALFGHGGAWVKHVASRAAAPLALFLVLSFVSLVFGSAVTAWRPAVPSFPAVPVSVWTAAGAAGGSLLVLAALRPRALAALRHLVPISGIGDTPKPLATFALTQLPSGHLKTGEEEAKGKAVRFQRFAQTLAELGSPVEFRIVFGGGGGRALLCVRGDRGDELLALARAHLPEFRVEEVRPVRREGALSVWVKGVPQPSEDPLGPVARFFLENGLDGEYGVTLAPARANSVARLLKRRQQRRLARDSSVQGTVQHLDSSSTSKTAVDHLKQVEQEEAVKQLERMTTKRPVKVSVRVSAESRAAAAQGAKVLSGTLSSGRKADGLRTGGEGWTLMLPSEAAPYLWIPQVSIGTPVLPSARFELPPKLEGEVLLGEVVSAAGRTTQEARVHLDQLAKHILVTGMTGSGKTTSCVGLLLQLHQLGVPFLVIEPAKSEYRGLVAAIPGLQVFTLGDEETAPFRLNLFEPPPGVKVQKHLENLEAVWNASFVSYAPLPYVLKEVIAQTYVSCGWNIRRNMRGRPITLSDLRATVGKVAYKLGYERKVTMDVEAALKTRITSLELGGKAPLFGSLASTPLEAVLRRPTVIELKEISSDEEKAFVAALLLANISAYVEARGQSKSLRHFTLVEEAHRLLPNVSTEKGDPESADPRQRMVEQFSNMLAEVRAYGEGLGIVEQIPTKIIPDAIKNTATKVAHRVPAEDDRLAMAGAMNMSEEQAEVFSALKPGEAVVSVEANALPIRVEVRDEVARLGVPMGQATDEDVRKRMAEFYLKNPLPREAPGVAEEELAKLVDSEAFKRRFVAGYREWYRTGSPEPLVEAVLDAAGGPADGEALAERAKRLFGLGVAFFLPLDKGDRDEFPLVFGHVIEKAVMDGRQGR
jgi:Helicase HerA, central domain